MNEHSPREKEIQEFQAAFDQLKAALYAELGPVLYRIMIIVAWIVRRFERIATGRDA